MSKSTRERIAQMRVDRTLREFTIRRAREWWVVEAIQKPRPGVIDDAVVIVGTAATEEIAFEILQECTAAASVVQWFGGSKKITPRGLSERAVRRVRELAGEEHEKFAPAVDIELFRAGFVGICGAYVVPHPEGLDALFDSQGKVRVDFVGGA